MYTFDEEVAGLGDGTGGAPGLADAVRVALAPLRVAQVFDPAADYVLRGTGPSVLELLRERPPGTKMVAEPDGYHPAELADAVVELHPGWTRRGAEAARLTVYKDAPVGLLARFGQVLHAAWGRGAEDGELSWLLTLAHDVGRATTATDATDAADVRLRWNPDLVEEIARAGDAPGRSAAHATLTALLYVDRHHWARSRHHMLESSAGDAYLARHADALAEVTTGSEFHVRSYVAARCARSPEAHTDLVAELAVDADAGVRSQALATLSLIDGPRQVDVLRRHLRTAPTDRLPDALARLGDLDPDGGVVAIEEALAGGGRDTGPLDPGRERLLRRVVFRARVLRSAEPAVPVPPVTAPQDAALAEELRALRGLRPGSGKEEDRAWQVAESKLALLPDVRALRDARRAAGAADADRWTAELLITRADGWGRKIGAALTPEGAERWWPLFAERLDLADEYLDGGDGKRHPDHYAVDTRTMILTILERFPAAPEALVPRLTSFALGTDRHRLPARRVLGDHPAARAAARAALSDSDSGTRSSAAEWLAELGEPGAVAPEPGWEFGEGVLPASVRDLPASTLWWLDRFREQARERGVPAADVDRWLGLARPVLRTAPDGGGPVVGRLGSPLLLPPDVPTPATVFEPDYRNEYQLIVTLDLAAIPPGATDLPLPPDGQVLLFANVELEDELLAGGAVYVPAGTPVEERETSVDYEAYGYGSPEDLDESLRRSPDFRLVPGVSLPSCPLDAETRAAHPHAETLQAVWSEQSDEGGEWQLGGHAYDFDGMGDPAWESAGEECGKEPGERDSRPEDWVVLAQWVGVPMGILYWTINRRDLEVLRFDRVVVQMYANP
ncbi:hypothetical protein [Promicromonospora sp. NPDC050249]|uniref:hypothetical protein n=1 Tax=Promicromonospora sp. NPDC050249 TaxID=3154743 RepID=UPI0033FE9FA8